MKKILLFLLITSALYSQAQIYMGTSYGSFNETFSEVDQKENSDAIIKLKIGYGDREAYAIEFSLDYTKVDANASQVDRYALNVDLVKAFDFPYVNPFFKAGFGTGFVDMPNGSHYTFGSFNLGTGIYIPINTHLDIELGYDYKYVSYEKSVSENVGATSSITSNISVIYAGVNLRF